MRNQSLFAGLDIGTTGVRCVVGEPDRLNDGALSIIGFGSSPNRGMRKGVIVHPEEVGQSIAAAVEEAERVTGHRIQSVTVNVNGSHVESETSRGVVAISNSDRTVHVDDRYRVEDAATIMQLPPNREIIQLFAKNYFIDGQGGIKDPVGMQAVRLEVDALIMTASTPILRSLDDLLTNNLRLNINHHTTSALAAAEAVLDRESRESGSAVIDIGAGTTNIAVMDEGEVEHVAVIPVGSMHITNDLAIGLRTELEVAEKIKREYVDLEQKQRGTKQLAIGREHLTFSLEDVDMIVRARLEELAEQIDKELKRAGYSRKLPGGIIITGGGAQLSGIEHILKDNLQLAVRKGKLAGFSGLSDSVSQSHYHTAVGL
ncbi:cell division protein FtsA, partial [Candidatus Saccharibacteria bacterium]|nr:cell division protein FtsA [Candidatus Saccharibacteria bacterium]